MQTRWAINKGKVKEKRLHKKGRKGRMGSNITPQIVRQYLIEF